MIRGIWLPVVIMTAVMALAIAAAKPQAQEVERRHEGHFGQGHDPLHPFYKEWHDARGMSCCNGSDCRPTEHRVVGEKVQVKLNGEWTDVPPDKIRPYASPDMGTHVCAPPPEWGAPKDMIFCVVLGSGV